MTTLGPMKNENNKFEAAIQAHDQAVSAYDLNIWIGAEPTFTNRFSESVEWLSEALGGSKQGYARRILQHLCREHPNALVLRTLGRQYAKEKRPRWSLGLYQRRDRKPLAVNMPPDPLDGSCPCEEQTMRAFRQELQDVMEREGWYNFAFEVEETLNLRIVFRQDGRDPEVDLEADQRLSRASPHEHPIPLSGAVDELAANGNYLISLGCSPVDDQTEPVPCLELPAFDDVATFQRFVGFVALAATASGLAGLVWRGFPPPVDQTVAWTTLTPDPAVLEINSAPAASAGEFLAMNHRLYRLAETEGLWPYRLQYTGNISDSGGGGQFTLGGPTPEQSPFFAAPQLLPRLIRYLNCHPALSYWFAPLYVGSHSQSPRPDENVQESFSELAIALRQLAIREAPEPEFIWRSLSPFLVDTSGNAHRSELNIEKLWNPYLPGRGRLGLVEFRAFRMPRDPQAATSIAALLRAVVAMLSRRDMAPDLINWGDQLHDRFALPFHLREDLLQIFADLADSGLELAEPITRRLLEDSARHVGSLAFSNCRLTVDQAIEFWPLLGDAASQETGSSRLVDASTVRLQLSVRIDREQTDEPLDWQLLAGPYRLPLRQERDPDGQVGIMGLRYRSFVPWVGLHPGLQAQTPIQLTLISPTGKRALRITLHEWQPESKPYDGLPATFEEALRRREERFMVEEIPIQEVEIQDPPNDALSDYCFDLRRI